ncbi:ARMADILLO REPEAT ONLY 4 [Salix koriyanagi]|uniref:ARMADILLO REPEAT ONLY 4 n=1 Tax=Salix koriyanagi TaxID=2511006 RepID=A0A9Q1ABS5_9ROSI|nr:ARMADILLO REPEAT ONLY 4 [Salix koriyanagi]
MSSAAAVTSTTLPPHGVEEKTVLEELYLPILLADRVIKSAQEAESSKQDCSDLAKQLDRLSQMLRSAVRLAISTPLYDRPLRRIASEITKNLDRARTPVRKCKKHSGVFRQVFCITTIADFRKVSSLLESSIGDMKWLLSIFESDGGAHLSLPPIASNDPILAWVWSSISAVQMGQVKDRDGAANQLASLALDNDRNKKMIVEEGGIFPLLKLLKEGASAEARIAAATALFNIANGKQRVRLIVEALETSMIVGVLGDSPIKVQISVANLVARMADLDDYAREEFMRLNVTRPLVSLLSNHLNLQANYNRDSSSHGGSHNKKRLMETPEVQLKLKVSYAEALWKLSKGSLSNSRKITEMKGLLCLATIVEREKGELQFNCLMTIMEITAVAESNADFRHAAFKPNLPGGKAVLDQLLRVIQEESDPKLQIPAIRSIGCLARTFSTRETRIMGPLVCHLGNNNADIATEAAMALGKFACPENFNCSEHSKAIIEFNGVPPLMRLLRSGDEAQLQGLVLLCYLALNAGTSKALVQARALNALERAARYVLAQHPEMKGLVAKAIHLLIRYQAGATPSRQSLAS